jgi:dihydroorotase
VAVAGAITVGRQGVALAPLGALAELGIRLFTDDGRGVQDARLLRRALEYGSMFNIVLAEHCEDEVLAAGGQMHEGRWSSALGIPGQPSIAEEVMLERDLALVRVTGAPMHFLHLSTARSVELVRRARAEGLPVTAEATPHHLALTDAEVASFDPVFKVNPPLRGEADVAALRQGVVDGVIEAIATDHAPHPAGAKDVPFDLAAPGMLGLETALSIALETIGEAIGLAGVFDRCSTGPARVAGLSSRGHGGPLFIGRPAHLCVLDPSARRRFEPARSASRSRNSPFARRELVGAVRHTLVGGEIVVRDGEAQR